MKRIILSPHLDDAVLSLGGFLHAFPETLVITFFSDRPKKRMHTEWDRATGFEDSDTAIDSRMAEDLAAFEVLKVTNVVHLAYLDAQYRKESPTIEQLIEAMTKVIEEFIGDDTSSVEIYGPGLEKHPDHHLIKNLLTHYASQKKDNFRYFHYQDIPYAISLFESSQHNLKSIEEQIHGNRIIIELSELDMLKKIEAVKKYWSQLVALGGENALTESILEFSNSQAAVLESSAPYVEVVYEI